MTQSKAKICDPKTVNLRKGHYYYWCSCGQSQTEPFCDGLGHLGLGIDPLVFQPQENQTAQLCTCKTTPTPPYYNNNHCQKI